MKQTDPDVYNELACYTLAHRDPFFIHQLAVDAYTAQSADAQTKPMAVAFALIGLCLHFEKGYSGKQVQQAHMRLAARRKQWPQLPLPSHRGAIEISHVLATAPGSERDEMIERWCRAVWEASAGVHEQVRRPVKDHLY